MTARPSAIGGIVETSLYVADLARSVAFYEGTLGLTRISDDDRLVALDAGPRSVLLLFRRGATLTAITTPEGVIPAHGGSGSIHVAFAVPAGSIDSWQAALAGGGVRLEGLTRWPDGGESLYLRDPDDHLLELATPGLWPNY